jgi:hypothetical protein
MVETEHRVLLRVRRRRARLSRRGEMPVEKAQEARLSAASAPFNQPRRPTRPDARGCAASARPASRIGGSGTLRIGPAPKMSPAPYSAASAR